MQTTWEEISGSLGILFLSINVLIILSINFHLNMHTIKMAWPLAESKRKKGEQFIYFNFN